MANRDYIIELANENTALKQEVELCKKVVRDLMKEYIKSPEDYCSASSWNEPEQRWVCSHLPCGSDACLELHKQAAKEE
jgi:hypothetical protein